jgi:O-antigen/teichoic acid export membrane protein
MRSSRSILGRFTLLTTANVIAAAMNVLLMLVVVKEYGDIALGDTTLALTLLTYALLLATGGTEVYPVTRVASAPTELRPMLSSIVAVRLASAVPVYAVMLAITFLVPQFRDLKLLVALFGLSVFVSAINLTWLTQSLHRTDVLAAVKGVTPTLNIILLLAMAKGMGWGLWTVPVSKVIAEAAVAIALIGWGMVATGPMVAPMPLRELWVIVRDGMPIGGTLLLRGLALASDILILGLFTNFVSGHDVGHYSAAYRIFTQLLGLGMGYFVILLPRVAECARISGPAMAQEISHSMKRIMPPAFAGLALLLVIASPMMRVFGPDFVSASNALRLLGLAFVANFVRQHYRQVLLSRGLQSTDLAQTAVGSIVSVGSKFALVPVMGINGAALGTLIGEVVLLALQWRSADREMTEFSTPIAASAGAS